MRLIRLECQNCGGMMEADADAKTAVCPYCGMKTLIDDETININYRYIDEAKVIEANMKKAGHDARYERYDAEDREYEEKYAKWRSKYLFWKTWELRLLGGGIAWLIVLSMIQSALKLAEGSWFDEFLNNLMPMPLMLCYMAFIFGGPYLWFTNPKKKHQKVLMQRDMYEQQLRDREAQRQISLESARARAAAENEAARRRMLREEEREQARLRRQERRNACEENRNADASVPVFPIHNTDYAQKRQERADRIVDSITNLIDRIGKQ
ncbi:MAG: hypothetical protein K6G61_02185 [Solobacterium sp.]|nr:hypothetical protein [Solobacterium sp.]